MRQEYYAYLISEHIPKVIPFTKHYSRKAAERHYEGRRSNYHLVIFRGKLELEATLREYTVDYKAKTITRTDV